MILDGMVVEMLHEHAAGSTGGRQPLLGGARI